MVVVYRVGSTWFPADAAPGAHPEAEQVDTLLARGDVDEIRILSAADAAILLGV